jgi:hypothetical protein
MGRLAGLVLVILGIGAAVQVYREGADQAFGGVLGRFSTRFQAPADRETLDRPLDGFQRAWNKSEDRVDQQLERPAARE